MRSTSLFCYLALFLMVLACGCGRNMETIKALNLDKAESAATVDLHGSVELLPFTGPAMDPNLTACLAMYKQKQFDSCRTSLERMLATDPVRWRVLYLLALVDYESEEYVKAERNLLTALRFADSNKSNRALIYLALGNSLEQQGKHARSEQHFLTALNLDPTCSPASAGLQRLTTLTSVDQ